MICPHFIPQEGARNSQHERSGRFVQHGLNYRGAHGGSFSRIVDHYVVRRRSGGSCRVSADFYISECTMSLAAVAEVVGPAIGAAIGVDVGPSP